MFIFSSSSNFSRASPCEGVGAGLQSSMPNLSTIDPIYFPWISLIHPISRSGTTCMPTKVLTMRKSVIVNSPMSILFVSSIALKSPLESGMPPRYSNMIPNPSVLMWRQGSAVLAPSLWLRLSISHSSVGETDEDRLEISVGNKPRVRCFCVSSRTPQVESHT